MDFGAVADGKTDSTGAINQAIQTARQLRSAVYVPKGTFIHGSFVLDGVSMFGAGPESVLWARSAEASNIYLRGTAPSLRALSVRITSSGRDVRNFAVYVDGATGFVVDRVHIDGGNAGGILNFGGTDGRITDNQISNTLADAIHNTNGARHILIAGNVVRRAGDDMIAVVSYRMQPISRDFLIENNDLQDQAFGRGIAVVGGQDVTIQGNRIVGTRCCAGIYLASEFVFRTNSVRNVIVRDNVLIDNSGPTRHGAIMIFADRGSVRQVRIERNSITGARHAAITLRGSVGDIALVDNRMVRPAEDGITGVRPSVFCRGNQLDGESLIPLCEPDDTVSATGATFLSPRPAN